MKVKAFKPIPTRSSGFDGSTVFIVYTEHAHLFLFLWGFTIRCRRRSDNWRHISLRIQSRKLETPGMAAGSMLLSTWRTRDGVTSRVKYSKKYLLIKALV